MSEEEKYVPPVPPVQSNRLGWRDYISYVAIGLLIGSVIALTLDVFFDRRIEVRISPVGPEVAQVNDEANGDAGSMADPTGSTGAVDLQNDRGHLPPATATYNQGAWEVTEFARLADNPIVANWIPSLRNPAPELWKTYPNIPNEDVPGFRVVPCEIDPTKDCVPDGAEYGTYSWPFCQQDERCDIIVPAREYVLISGDYKFLNLSCGPQRRVGCLLLIYNVADESYKWKDQSVDSGFAVHGRYWNGDELQWATWGLVSHASANMLNLPTFARAGEPLNFGDSGSNAGANCGVPGGCNRIDATVVITTGDAVIATLHAVVH